MAAATIVLLCSLQLAAASRHRVFDAAAHKIGRRAALSAALFTVAAPPAAPAATSDVAAIYDGVAATYDEAYSGSVTSRVLDFDGLRRDALGRASGAVLELGVGTGLNLPLYRAGGGIRSLDGVDVSAGMLTQAKPRAAAAESALGVRVQLKLGSVDALPYADNAFDTVTDTFSLCVFEQPQNALREARRVLAPGGLLLLLESDRSALSDALAFTRRVTAVAGSCAYDQDVLALVRDAGFVVEASQSRAQGLFRAVVARKPAQVGG